jgi:hypothetical protein
MEEQRSTAGQGIGIAGLILGIIAVPLALIPCTFPLALLLAAGGIILSAVGMTQASRVNGARGLPVAGLVVSVIGMMIALMWGLLISTAIHQDGKWWKNEIVEKISKKVEKDVESTFEDMDQEFEKINENLEDVLEDLEWDTLWDSINLSGKISDEEFAKVLNAYEDLIKNYTTLVNEAQQGKIAAVTEYAKVSAKELESKH